MISLNNKGLKLDEVVEIKVSGDYALRVQLLLLDYAQIIGPGKVEEAFKLISKQTENLSNIDPKYFHFETILILLNQIQNDAEAQGKLEDIPAPSPESPKV